MSGRGQHRTPAQWWLDPAIARLAFGASGTAGAPESAVFDGNRIALDLADPQQRRLGEFELLELIGEGGMGLVYRALQTHLQREVAVKLLSAGPWASPAYIERFEQEARHAAKLQHPAIVTVHELGELDGLVYYAMQLVRGPSLAQVLKQRGGRLPPREAAALMRTVAEAVDYAHALGVLHLDLKPANVLLGEDGQPRVADFGLSRFMEPGARLDNLQTAGTPSYMAPEQASAHGATISRATDVWGLGAILYESLCGQPPFESDDTRTTLLLLKEGMVRRPSRFAPMSPDLEAICLKCLAREPAQRYATARALADDLGRYLEGREVSVRPLGPGRRLLRWTRREPRLAAASALGVLSLVAGLAATTHQWQRAEATAQAAREQTWRTRAEAAWRLLESGRSVDAMPLLADNLREREALGDVSGVALERMRLGTLNDSGAQLIDVVATGAAGRALAISPDARRIALVDLDESVHLYEVAGGRRLWRSSVAAAARFRAVGLPITRVEFTTDGRHLLTATLEPSTFLRPHGRNNVLVDAADGSVLGPPPGRFPDFMDATYSADGSHALLRSHAGHAQLFRVRDWQPLSPQRSFPSLGGSWQVGDGGRFVARSINHRLELLDPKDLKPRLAQQFEAARGIQLWAAQPDGEQLALGNADGSVWLQDTRGMQLRQLHPAPSEAVVALAFSREGRWLLAAGSGRVWVWDVTSGVGAALPATRAIAPTRLQADAETGTVFAAGADDALLWQLPGATDEPLPARIADARPVVSQFAFGPSLPRNAAAYAPAAALVANLERNGELRMWRWRPPRMLAERGPARTDDELAFDGRHVVVVDGRRAQVLDVETGQPAGPALVHPQPVAYAALLPDGHGLATVAGRALRAFDWRAGAARIDPVLLAESPQRVAISPDGKLLLATTGGYADGAFRESASSLDLATGELLARDVPLPGPLDGLRFDAEGARVVHWRQGVARIRDARSLAPTGPPLVFGSEVANDLRDAYGVAGPAALAATSPILDAAFARDGTGLSLLLGGNEPKRPRLLEVDAGTGRVRADRVLVPGTMARLWPHPKGLELVIFREPQSQWVGARGPERPLPHAPGQPHYAQAISRDGRWLATATSSGLVVADRDSGQWATAVLRAPLAPGDDLVQLAFAPDAGSLLARSRRGEWAWWRLLPGRNGLAGVEAQLRLARRGSGAGNALAGPLPPAERARLRAADPGPPAEPPRPAPRETMPPGPLPTRVADRYLPLDLRPALTRPLDAASILGGGGPALLASLPSGPQRFLGVDYRIDGIVALRMPEAPDAHLFPGTSAEVPVPVPRVTALHLLMGGCCPMPGRPGDPYAYVVLRYQDGSRARMPVLHHTHMLPPENSQAPSSARIGWVNGAPDFPHEGRLRLYAVRLPNPHPGRAVAAIAFEASEFFASGPLVVAATVQLPPVASTAMASRSP